MLSEILLFGLYCKALHALPAELLLLHWLHIWSFRMQNKNSGTADVDRSRNFVLRSGLTLMLFWDLFNACITISVSSFPKE